MTAVPAHYCTIPTAPASPAPRGSPPCPPGSPSPITTFRSCDRGKCLREHRRRKRAEEYEAMPDESPPASSDRDLMTKIVAAFVRRNQITPDQLANVIAIGRLGNLANLWQNWPASRNRRFLFGEAQPFHRRGHLSQCHS